MRVEDADLDLLDSLVERLDDIRHDLGKYIGFETRFLGEDPSEGDLRAALRADLLATRRHGDRVEPAWVLWARLRPAALDADPDVRTIDAALRDLQQVDLEGPMPVLVGAAERARDVTTAARSLARRARARLDDSSLESP